MISTKKRHFNNSRIQTSPYFSFHPYSSQMISVFLAPLVFAGVASARNINNTVNYTPPSSFAVIPGVFESRNYSQAFVPENFLEFKDENAGSQPHFQVFDQDLAKNILGSNPEIVYLVSEPGCESLRVSSRLCESPNQGLKLNLSLSSQLSYRLLCTRGSGLLSRWISLLVFRRWWLSG